MKNIEACEYFVNAHMSHYSISYEEDNTNLYGLFFDRNFSGKTAQLLYCWDALRHIDEDNAVIKVVQNPSNNYIFSIDSCKKDKPLKENSTYFIKSALYKHKLYRKDESIKKPFIALSIDNTNNFNLMDELERHIIKLYESKNSHFTFYERYYNVISFND